MTKDILLIRAGLFHLAIPAERLLEIIHLDLYQNKMKNEKEDLCSSAAQKIALKPSDTSLMNVKEKKSSDGHMTDRYRVWRDHILPVMHFAHYLDTSITPTSCTFSLVYQANEKEMIFLDVDHIYSIIHMNTTEMKPIYYPYKNLQKISRTVCSVPGFDVFAFILQDSLDLIEENKKIVNDEQYHFDFKTLKIIEDIHGKSMDQTEKKKKRTPKAKATKPTSSTKTL